MLLFFKNKLCHLDNDMYKISFYLCTYLFIYLYSFYVHCTYIAISNIKILLNNYLCILVIYKTSIFLSIYLSIHLFLSSVLYTLYIICTYLHSYLSQRIYYFFKMNYVFWTMTSTFLFIHLSLFLLVYMYCTYINLPLHISEGTYYLFKNELCVLNMYKHYRKQKSRFILLFRTQKPLEELKYHRMYI